MLTKISEKKSEEDERHFQTNQGYKIEPLRVVATKEEIAKIFEKHFGKKGGFSSPETTVAPVCDQSGSPAASSPTPPAAPDPSTAISNPPASAPTTHVNPFAAPLNPSAAPPSPAPPRPAANITPPEILFTRTPIIKRAQVKGGPNVQSN